MAMGRRGRGAAGGGGGAQCAYPVLAAAPRRMGTTVSRCAVALRRTAAGPAGGLRTRAHARGGAGGRRPAVAGAGVRAGAPWAASGRRTGVGVRSARARAPARRRRGNSRPCCRGPEAGRGEHTGKRHRAVGGGAAGGGAASGREDGLAPPCAHSPARCVAASARAHLASTNNCRTSTGPLSTCTAQRPARAGVCRQGARPPVQPRARKAAKQGCAPLDRPPAQGMIYAATPTTFKYDDKPTL